MRFIEETGAQDRLPRLQYYCGDVIKRRGYYAKSQTVKDDLRPRHS